MPYRRRMHVIFAQHKFGVLKTMVPVCFHVGKSGTPSGNDGNAFGTTCLEEVVRTRPVCECKELEAVLLTEQVQLMHSFAISIHAHHVAIFLRGLIGVVSKCCPRSIEWRINNL